MSSKREFLENWYRKVWTELNTETIEEQFHPEQPSKGLENQPFIELEAFKQFHTAITGLLDDIQISVDKVIEDGPWTSVMVTIRAVSKINNTDITITGAAFARIEDGKIREGYDHVDFVSMWMQLGLLPPNALELGLQGQKIA